MDNTAQNQIDKNAEEGLINGSASAPPAYDPSTYNTGYVHENTFNHPPAYVEKDARSPPGNYAPMPAYTGAPGYTGPPPAGVQPGPYPNQPGGYPNQAPVGYYPVAGQQPVGYGMNTGAPQAYVFVQPNPLTDPPNDYLGYSLFVTICCCWIVGLFAIMKASECRTAIRMGNRPEAVLKSRQARKYSNIALGLGIVSIALAAVFFGIYYGILINNYR